MNTEMMAITTLSFRLVRMRVRDGRVRPVQHSRHICGVQEADQVAEQRGSVSDHQVDGDDGDDSCRHTVTSP